MQVWEHIRDGNYYIIVGEANNRSPGAKDQIVVVYRPLYESDPDLFVREKSDWMVKFRPVEICDGCRNFVKAKGIRHKA